jgi:ASC-1-like (ASCH) protein
MALPETYKNPYGEAQHNPGLLMSIGTSFEDSFMGYNTLGLGLNIAQHERRKANFKKRFGDFITEEKFNSLGIRKHKWKEFMTEGEAKALLLNQREQELRNKILYSGSETGGFFGRSMILGASLAGSSMDPINFLPVFGQGAKLNQVRKAKQISEHTISNYIRNNLPRSQVFNAGVRRRVRRILDDKAAALAEKRNIYESGTGNLLFRGKVLKDNIYDGAKLGALGYAITEPFIIGGRKYLGLDYTVEESLFGLAASVGFGGALHLSNIYAPKVGDAFGKVILGTSAIGAISTGGLTLLGTGGTLAAGMFFGRPKTMRFNSDIMERWIQHMDVDSRDSASIPIKELEGMMEDWQADNANAGTAIHNVLSAIDTGYQKMRIENDAIGMAEKRQLFMEYFGTGAENRANESVINFFLASAEDYRWLGSDEKYISMKRDIARMASSEADADLIKSGQFLDAKKINMLTLGLTDTMGRQLKLFLDQGNSIDEFMNFYPAAYNKAVSLIAGGELDPSTPIKDLSDDPEIAKAQQFLHNFALTILAETTMSGRAKVKDGSYTDFNPFPVDIDAQISRGPDSIYGGKTPEIVDGLGNPVIFYGDRSSGDVINLGTDPIGRNWGRSVITNLPIATANFTLPQTTLNKLHALGLSDADIVRIASEVFNGNWKDNDIIPSDEISIASYIPYNVQSIITGPDFWLDANHTNAIGAQVRNRSSLTNMSENQKRVAAANFPVLNTDSGIHAKMNPEYLGPIMDGDSDTLLVQGAEIPTITDVDGRRRRVKPGDYIWLEGQSKESQFNEFGVPMTDSYTRGGVFKVMEMESVGTGVYAFDESGKKSHFLLSPEERISDMPTHQKRGATDSFGKTHTFDDYGHEKDLIFKNIEQGYVPKELINRKFGDLPTIREILITGKGPDDATLNKYLKNEGDEFKQYDAYVRNLLGFGAGPKEVLLKKPIRINMDRDSFIKSRLIDTVQINKEPLQKAMAEFSSKLDDNVRSGEDYKKLQTILDDAIELYGSTNIRETIDNLRNAINENNIDKINGLFIKLQEAINTPRILTSEDWSVVPDHVRDAIYVPKEGDNYQSFLFDDNSDGITIRYQWDEAAVEGLAAKLGTTPEMVKNNYPYRRQTYSLQLSPIKDGKAGEGWDSAHGKRALSRYNDSLNPNNQEYYNHLANHKENMKDADSIIIVHEESFTKKPAKVDRGMSINAALRAARDKGFSETPTRSGKQSIFFIGKNTLSDKDRLSEILRRNNVSNPYMVGDSSLLKSAKKAKTKADDAENIAAGVLQRAMESKPSEGTSMLMNFKVTNNRPKRPGLKGDTTMEWIKSGDRTATTRKASQVKGVKKGDLINFKSGKDIVQVRVTSDPYPTSQVTAKEWSDLEGWHQSMYETYGKDDYMQFTYEKVDQAKPDAMIFKAGGSRGAFGKGIEYTNFGSRADEDAVNLIRSKVEGEIRNQLQQVSREHADNVVQQNIDRASDKAPDLDIDDGVFPASERIDHGPLDEAPFTPDSDEIYNSPLINDKWSEIDYDPMPYVMNNNPDVIRRDVNQLMIQVKKGLGLSWDLYTKQSFADPVANRLLNLFSETGATNERKTNKILQNMVSFAEANGIKLVQKIDDKTRAYYSPRNKELVFNPDWLTKDNVEEHVKDTGGRRKFDKDETPIEAVLQEEYIHAIVDVYAGKKHPAGSPERIQAFKDVINNVRSEYGDFVIFRLFEQYAFYKDSKNSSKAGRIKASSQDDVAINAVLKEAFKWHSTEWIAQELIANIFHNRKGTNLLEETSTRHVPIIEHVRNTLEQPTGSGKDEGKMIFPIFDMEKIPSLFIDDVKAIGKQVEALSFFYHNNQDNTSVYERQKHGQELSARQRGSLQSAAGYFKELKALLSRANAIMLFDRELKANNGNHELAFHSYLERVENSQESYTAKLLGDLYGPLEDAGLLKDYMDGDIGFQTEWLHALLRLESFEDVTGEYNFTYRDTDYHVSNRAVAIARLLYNSELKKINDYNGQFYGDLNYSTSHGVSMNWDPVHMQNGGKTKAGVILEDGDVSLGKRIFNNLQDIDSGRSDFHSFMKNEVDIDLTKTLALGRDSTSDVWFINKDTRIDDYQKLEILYYSQERSSDGKYPKSRDDLRAELESGAEIRVNANKELFDVYNPDFQNRDKKSVSDMVQDFFITDHYDKILAGRKADDGDFYRSNRSELNTTIFYKDPMDRIRVMNEYSSYDPNVALMQDRNMMAKSMAVNEHFGRNSSNDSPLETAMQFLEPVFPKVQEDFGKKKGSQYAFHWFFYNVAKRRPEHFAKEMLGLNDVSANNTVSAIDSFMKFGAFLPTTIGMSGVSSLSDFGTIRKTLDDAIGDHIHKSVIRTIADSIKRSPERKKEMVRMGFTAALTISNLMRATGAAGDNMQKMYKWNKAVFDLSGMNYVMDLGRTVFTSIFMTGLGSASGMNWAQLPKRTTDTFTNHGITPLEWEIIRSSAKEVNWKEDGFSENTKIISRIDFENINSDLIIRYARELGYESVDPGLGRKLSDHLDNKYHKMLTDEMNKGVLMPGYVDRTLLNLGFQEGTWARAILSNMALYQQYPMSFLRKHFGPDIAKMASLNPDSMIRTAYFMGYMVMLGYLLNMIKDLLSNREPRVWGKSAAWGAIGVSGIGGIYTSMISGEWNDKEPLFNRMVNYKLGVPGAKVKKAWNLLGSESPGDFGSKSVQLGRSLTPFADFAPWKAAVDRVVFQPATALFDDGAWVRSRDNSLEKLGSSTWLMDDESVNPFD